MAEPLQAENLAALDGVAHGFFTRQGGVSEGIYASLNTGLGSSDERASVLENRARILAALGGETLCTLYQHHSALCATADGPWKEGRPPRADAAVTARPGVAVAVNTADCTPVLFADAENGVVAAAHAGWKGALGGVLQSTLSAMEKLGAKRENIVCAIGPVISRENYEVGPEFFARFVKEDPGYANLFAPAARAEHFLFDLPGFVRLTLERAGVDQMEDLRRCTFAEGDLFFSYRRSRRDGEPDYGRQLSAIMLTP